MQIAGFALLELTTILVERSSVHPVPQIVLQDQEPTELEGKLVELAINVLVEVVLEQPGTMAPF